MQHFSFVLTSIDSKWTFGFCRHDPKTDTALVVLSALPWHETFYKLVKCYYIYYITHTPIYAFIFNTIKLYRLLNHIASLTSNASGEDLWKFLEHLYTCGVPIPGNSVSIPLPNSATVITCFIEKYI